MLKRELMKFYIFALTLASLNAFASDGKDCRLLMRGYSTLIGNNSELEKSVEVILAKKKIELIEESDLREGDYTTDIIKKFEDYRGLPLHRYIMNKKSDVVLVPCIAFPLCSPVVVDSQVKSIDGIKYKDSYRFNVVSESGESKILESKFHHTYRGPLMFEHKDPAYFGSPEQIDLVKALAKNIPHCKTLEKR